MSQWCTVTRNKHNAHDTDCHSGAQGLEINTMHMILIVTVVHSDLEINTTHMILIVTVVHSD